MDPAQKSTQDPQNQPPVAPLPVPVGSVSKEQGPIPATENLQGYMEPSGAEKTPEISPEVAEAGVEVAPVVDSPKLTQEDRKIGVTHAKEHVPVTTSHSGAVRLPLTPQEAQDVIKLHKKVSDSILWLATLIVKQAKIMHKTITNSSVKN